MQEAGVEQPLRQQPHPPSAVEINGHEPATGFEVGQDRGARRDPVEVFQSEIDSGLARHGQ